MFKAPRTNVFADGLPEKTSYNKFHEIASKTLHTEDNSD